MKKQILDCEAGCDDINVLTDGGDAEGKILDASGNVAVVDEKAKEPEEKMVPVTALEAERGRRQTAEANVNTLTNHIKDLQTVAAQPETPSDALSKMDPDNVITVREVQEIIGGLTKTWEQKAAGNNSVNAGVLAELQVKADHHDYNDVIKTNLVNVLNLKPELKAAISSAPEEHRPILAYSIGIMDTEYQKKNTGKTHDDIAQRLKENAKKPGSVNSVAASADDTDLAKVIATESSADFEKRIAGVKAKGDN